MRMTRAIALLAIAGTCSWGKVAVVFRLASPPLPVEPGQNYALCAANVGTVSADLTLQFINVRTGAIVASEDLILPPPGVAGNMPDPCLNVTPDSLPGFTSASAGPPLLVALVVIKRGIFGRASTVTASVQVKAPDSTGRQRTVASLPLQLATLTNGRNTPIERVH